MSETPHPFLMIGEETFYELMAAKLAIGEDPNEYFQMYRWRAEAIGTGNWENACVAWHAYLAPYMSRVHIALGT